MGKLGDKSVQAAKPREARYLMADGDGLTLAVQPNGSKLWWLRYRFGGKPKTLSLGQYPLITLKEARERALEARKLLTNGVDPNEAKKAEKARMVEAAAVPVDTVEIISRDWFEKFGKEWVEGHATKISRRLERDLYPYLGKSEIRSVTPAQLLAVLRRVEARGALETAHRLHQNCGQIWRYAVASGLAERDITQDLKGALPPAKEKHLGSITDPKEIGALLRSIDEYKGAEVVRSALKLAPLFFVRPGELRQSKWDEFDLDGELWAIPAGRMKLRRPHVVPLSGQSLAILRDLRAAHNSEYLFPSPHSITRCISDMALLSAIRRMGYTKEEMTAHGFRAMASTNLEQLGFDVRLIELQLAHADQDQVRAAYKRETHLLRLEERKSMMQKWADYLDGLRAGAEILNFKRA